MKNLLRLRTKVFAITLILLLSISGVLSAQKIAIIDAGSSGSRLYVYDVNKKDYKIEVLYPKQGDKALSGEALSLVPNDPVKIKNFLINMTTEYKKKRGSQASKTPIDLYILATAGMRLKDQQEANSFYTQMPDSTQVFNGFRLKKAMTISGQYEGFYAWMAANYRNKTLGINPSSPQKELTYTGTPYGILEIGGASMQIAFAAQPLFSPNPDTLLSRRGYSHIYSKSYLGGGVNEIHDKYKNKWDAKKKIYNFNEDLEDINDKCEPSHKFIGLGKAVEIVLDGIRRKGSTKSYLQSLTNKDSTDHYHPFINAHYICWVIKKLNLESKLEKAKVPSHWTEGAALDIIINNEQPKAFNYQHPN